MDTLITAKLNLTRAKDAMCKSDSDWTGGHGMFNNFRIALDKAMADTNDDDLLNYYIVEVESFDCIAHVKYTYGSGKQSFDKYVYPFDENRLYPVQELIIKPCFKR